MKIIDAPAQRPDQFNKKLDRIRILSSRMSTKLNEKIFYNKDLPTIEGDSAIRDYMRLFQIDVEEILTLSTY